MLTPQEVAEHAFSKASFGGYNMAMVDEFLDLVTADYTSLYKENATLKAKMKVLAEKVEEYRATEDAMRKAMLSAQKTADELVKDAESRATTIVEDAEREAKDKIAAIRQEVENEQLRLTAAQNATSAYIAKLKDLYQNEMEYLSSLSKLSATPKIDMVAQTADAIGSAVEKTVERTIAEPVVEEKKEPPVEPLEVNALYQELKRGVIHGGRTEEADAAPAEVSQIDIPAPAAVVPMQDEEEEDDEATTRRIDFKNLKFGKDYQI